MFFMRNPFVAPSKLGLCPSDDEKPLSTSSLLVLLSAILSVSMSHSLSSGIFPGFVLMVCIIEMASITAKNEKTPE